MGNARSKLGSVFRSRKGTSEIPQFLLVLYLLLLLFLVPLLDLVNLFVASAIQYLATNDIAAKVATQPSYSSYLNALVNEADSFQSTGLAKFVNLTPNGGYVGCGNDLYVKSTNVSTGAVTSSAPDLPLSQTIDTTANMYEISVQSNYSISPLVSLAAWPILGDAPGLGKPASFTFTANRPVEQLSGLVLASNGGSGTTGGGSVTPFNRLASGGSAPSNPAIVWRNPAIYQQIQAAGQTVVSVTVLLVNPNNSSWTPSGVSVQSGQRIWLDTQAIGTWQTLAGTMCDANGLRNSAGSGAPLWTAPIGSLVGVMGTTGPVQNPTPNAFLLGNYQYNIAPPGTGAFGMAQNNYTNAYGGCSGAQMVRVLVVQ